MKKICAMMIFIFGITVFNSLASKVEASVTTFSEKVWSIEMSMDIKNTTENLNRIEVMSPENEIININYKLNSSDEKIIEIYPTETYEPGTYEIIIKKGFESETGKILEKEYKETFTVERSLVENDLYGNWTNEYENSVGKYMITTDFEANNKAYMSVLFSSGATAFGTGIYSLENGIMTMNIPEINRNVEGRVLYYNANKFLVYSAVKDEYSEFNSN